MIVIGRERESLRFIVFSKLLFHFPPHLPFLLSPLSSSIQPHSLSPLPITMYIQFPTLDNVDNDCCMRDDSAITNNSNTAVSMIEVDDRAILPGRSDRGRGVKFAPIIHPEEDEETVGSTSDRRIVDDDNNSNNNVNDDTPPIILLPPSMSSTYNNTHFDTEIEDLDYGNKQSLKSVEGDHSDYNKFNMSSTTTTAMMTTTTTTTAATIKRKRPTGLGNLGNTCFMNSTLQCLAHTPPLRRYFLSGMYERDLNVDNPLGTGGELAREFASLMREMWLEKVTISTNTVDEENKTRNHPASNGIYASSRMYSSGNGGSYPNTATSHLSNGIGGGGVSSMTPSVTYPRSFKTTLGKHAPQFVGYDQHDSQELAIYLLDALHEDTNRVRKKPYVENPEQSTTETDEYAANKAWDVHLQREDSFIVHNFMGQVKSRLQCPNNDNTTNLAASEEVKEEKEKDACCGRVSTTFDPYMYLSVPIPGSTDRVVKVVFVPRVSSSTSTTDNSSARPVVSAEFTIKLCKNSNLRSLRREVVKSARECYRYTEDELEEDDVQMVDIFNNKVRHLAESMLVPIPG